MVREFLEAYKKVESLEKSRAETYKEYSAKSFFQQAKTS